MQSCSVVSREWKTRITTVAVLMCILCATFIFPSSVEAVTEFKDAFIRASDGKVYEIEYTKDRKIENFSIYTSDGETPPHAIAAELYQAIVVLETPPITYKYTEDLTYIVDTAYQSRLDAETLLAISGVGIGLLTAYYTGGIKLIDLVDDAILLTANLSEKELILLKAKVVADTFASYAKHSEKQFNDYWLYADRNNVMGISTIKEMWAAYRKEILYRGKTLDIVSEKLYIADPLHHLIGLIPGLGFEKFVISGTFGIAEVILLDQMREETEKEANHVASQWVKDLFGMDVIAKTIVKLENAGFFDRKSPMKIGVIEDRYLTLGYGSRLVEVTDKFKDPNGDKLRYSVDVTNKNVADVKWVSLLKDGESKATSMLEITPKRAGETEVIVIATDPYDLSVTQHFKVTVEAAPQDLKPVGTIPSQTLIVGGSSKTVDVSPYFSSQHVNYMVSSSPNGIVLESRSGSRVTITPSQAGSASVVVTAFDSNGSSAIQTIPVTVQPERVRIVQPPLDPTFTPPRTPNPAVKGLREGVSVITQLRAGFTLNVRKRPGINEELEEIVGNGVTGIITDGPQSEDGYRWWRVKWDRSRVEGWSVEEDRGQILFRRPPDLEIQDLDVSKDEVAPGERFEIEVRVRNNGPGESAPTEVSLYYSPNHHSNLTELQGDGDLKVAGKGTLDVPSLRSGRRRTLSLRVEAPMTPNAYYYGALLPSNIYDTDYKGDLDPEALHNNLAREERVEVSSPDLTVESISANKSTVDPGESFRLEATVRNQGIGKPTRNATLRYYRSSDANISDNDTEVGDDSVSKNNLDTNGTEREWINLTAPTQPGVYYYGTCVDLREERDTDNNCSSAVAITVRETGPPDLVVSIPTLSANTLAPGESVTLTATVRNQGVGPASATTVRAYRSPNINISDVDTEVGDVSIGSLPPGGTQTVQIRVEVPLAAGMYYYGVCVEQAANERNTVNNCPTGAAFTVENLAPVRSSKVPPKKLFVDSDAVIVDLPQYFSDPNNDVPTYTVQSSAVGIVDLALLGSPISYLRIQPLAVGNTAVTVTASDGELTASQTFSVSVVTAPTENEAPVAVGVIPPQSLTIDGESSTVDISVYFSDANGDTLTYAAWPDDKNVVRLQRTGAFLTIIPKTAERATVTVRATDPEGLQAFQRISVFVNTTEDTELPAETWMPDANLRAAVRGALGLGPNDSLTQQAIENLTSLRYLGPDLRDNQKITDLTGLEHAVNLEHLDLYAHFIRDLRPLVRLGKLRSLWLAGNRIANIRPLTSLPLEQVDLGGNPITDFAPLSELTSLTRLDFWGNRLGDDDLSTIKGLTQLTELDLRNNQISDVTPLTQLVNLKKLRIKGNPISDMSPLLTLTDLEIDTEISDKPPSEPDMGITPEVPDLIVASISVGKTEIYPGAVFRMDVVIRNQGKAPSGDATVRFYRSMDETITTADTQVNRSNLRSIAVDATRNKWARLPTPNTAGVYYYGVCIEGVADESDTENNCSTAVKITVGTVPAKPPVVERPTPVSPEIGETPPQADSLAKQVFEKHGKTLGRQDVKEVLPNVLTTLKEPDIQALLTPATINLVIEDPDLLKTMVPTISDKFITLLKTDAEIKTLLSDPQVQTLLRTPAAIDELAKLLGISVAPPPPTSEEVVFPDAILAQAVRKTLKLPAGAAIPKAKLATLTQLEVPFDSPETERIKDLTGLEQAKQLTTFKIYHSVPDVTPLAGLTKLETVALFSASSEDRSITDLSPFKKLTNLRRLFLENVNSDFTPLTGLTKLEELSLFAARIDDNNLISLIPILAGMKNLRKLNLGFNSIQDATPLAALANLESLVLWENPVTDASLRQLKLQNPGLDILGVDIPAAPSNNASVTVLPDETALLPNYPNPFNPETWIPYELATDTDVRITIYNAQGVVVRSLSLGHQSAGYYTDRERAAYWDGRNALGEQVASGVYFYQFETAEMSSMRKMVILQ